MRDVHVDEWLVDHIRGELDPAERARVDIHLAACGECRASRDRVAGLMTELARTAPAPPAIHWGAYRAEVRDGHLVAMHPFAADPDPSPIGASYTDALTDKLRIPRPMIRKGWLEKGPRLEDNARGAEPFVSVPWDEALDIVARELKRVKDAHGNQAIFAGSYGWASAGRFHHAQSQLRRFFNMWGGHAYSVNSYSTAAGDVILTRVMGGFRRFWGQMHSWDQIARDTQLVVSFGGISLKNGQVDGGGMGRHAARVGQKKCKERGVEFVFAQFVDMYARPSAKLVPVGTREAFDGLLDEGAGFAGFAAGEIGQVPSDPDIAAIPDLSSYTPVPWQANLARFACDVTVEGEEWPYCPRTILRRALAKAKKKGYEFKMGPLEYADRVGLDKVLGWMEHLWRELGDFKYRPCPLLRKLVRAGHLGRKSGRGFFVWQDGVRVGAATAETEP